MWDPSPSFTCNQGWFYANYLHVQNWVVAPGQAVTKGQLLGHTGVDGKSGFPHLHFEIRAGRAFQKYCCDPWKYLPNADNDYSSFTATVTLTPNYNGIPCEAVVNVSVPPNQLTFNRIELHITNNGDTTKREFDFCKDNFDHTFDEMENPRFEGNLIISPKVFSSLSYRSNKPASHGFEFLNLPSGRGTVNAKVYDVFDNVVSTSDQAYTC